MGGGGAGKAGGKASYKRMRETRSGKRDGKNWKIEVAWYDVRGRVGRKGEE